MATVQDPSPCGERPPANAGGMATRLILAISALVVVLQLGFIASEDLISEQSPGSGGGEPEIRGIAAGASFALHGVAVLITLGFALVTVRSIVRRESSRRASSMLEVIRNYRSGRWSGSPVRGRVDEWTVVELALRGLGPRLERQVRLFVACDRKATVARLGRVYERALLVHARLVVMRARAARRGGSAAREWEEVEQAGMSILAELGKLARPEHPALAGIVAGTSSLGEAEIPPRPKVEPAPLRRDRREAEASTWARTAAAPARPDRGAA